MKKLACAVALFVAVSLGFMSEAHSRPVAFKAISQTTAIVLTDEFHDECPISTNAAVIYDTEDGVFRGALGCWIYDEDTDQIGIWWRFADGDERTQTLDADVFTRVNKPEPVI